MRLRKKLKFSDESFFLELEYMTTRSLLLASTDWSKLKSRWQISIEDYHSSFANKKSASSFLGQAYAVYGEVDLLGKVLLFVVSRQKTTLYADELIETCLNDLNPLLARELKCDIGILLKLLSFESCEVVTSIESRQRESS